MTNFDDVGDFHRRFGLDNVTHNGAHLRVVGDDLMQFRIKFLKEELKEFTDAYDARDEAGMFDALLDLVYVAMGTAHLRGYPWQQGWNEVQRANMAKVRASEDGADSKRGSPFDVVKPPGWQPPDIAAVLRLCMTRDTECPSCHSTYDDPRTRCLPGTKHMMPWCDDVQHYLGVRS